MVMTNFIALYGGSFNLPTDTHRAVGVAVRDQVKPDEVWYLVAAQNPHKSAEGMADFSHRVEMTRLNIANELKLVVSEAEKEIRERVNSTQTADILKELLHRFSEKRFAWILGADCFADLHTWSRYEYILEHVPIIVVPRKGWTERAMESPAALHYLTRRIHIAESLKTDTGWFMLNFPEDDVSATNARIMVSRGERPDAVRPEVYQYVRENRLFM